MNGTMIVNVCTVKTRIALAPADGQPRGHLLEVGIVSALRGGLIPTTPGDATSARGVRTPDIGTSAPGPGRGACRGPRVRCLDIPAPWVCLAGRRWTIRLLVGGLARSDARRGLALS